MCLALRAAYGCANRLSCLPICLATTGHARRDSCPGTITIVGTSASEVIIGTNGPDVISGGGGNDTLQGLEGDDVLCGGSGQNTLVGGEGNDRLLGQEGNDTLNGDSGNDILYGNKRSTHGATIDTGPHASSCAALIPIRKTAAWWILPEDERRQIFEDSSSHVKTGLKYLPAIARRLHHCRDLGENEPFDFLTWFEYDPSDSAAFEGLVAELRATEEWKCVDREIDIRVVRDEA